MDIRISPCRMLRGRIEVPGDKSVSHRAVMLGALSEGITEISGFLMSADCLSTISCFEKMGVRVDRNDAEKTVTVEGRSLHGLRAPSELLYTGNSGTTTRIISGILAGQSFESMLDGDSSIRRRPMKRIIDPLLAMGASVRSEKENGCVPLRIKGGSLHGICWRSPVASAQVKSGILLAGLYADSETSVLEPALSRNHTELMLKAFGGSVLSEPLPDPLRGEEKKKDRIFYGLSSETAGGWKITVRPEPRLTGRKICVPGDISSAAYFMAAAAIVPGAEVLISNVGVNPTRNGILKVMRAMGADISLSDEKLQGFEETASILVRSSSLHGTVIGGSLIPTLIDELPVCAVLACFAEGETVIRDARELRVKESDRIAVMTEELNKMGADITPTEDGMIIRGGRSLHGAEVDAHADHRAAMSLTVAALAAEGATTIHGAECVGISYPDFFKDLDRLRTGC